MGVHRREVFTHTKVDFEPKEEEEDRKKEVNEGRLGNVIRKSNFQPPLSLKPPKSSVDQKGSAAEILMQELFNQSERGKRYFNIE